MARQVDTSGFNLEDFEIKQWGKNKDFLKPFPVTLPSGQRVLIRRLEMTDILKLGINDELDFMTKALVADDKKPAAEKSNSGIMGLVKNSDNVDSLEKSINLVCREGLVFPKVRMVPPVQSQRMENELYIDEIPFTDRLEMFGQIFDTEGLTDFREESQVGLGDVPNEPEVSLPTE